MRCLRKYCYRGKKLPRANKDLDTSVKTRQFISRKGGSRDQCLWRVVVAVLLTAAVFYSVDAHLYTAGYAGGCSTRGCTPDTPSPRGLPHPWPWGPKLAPDIPVSSGETGTGTSTAWAGPAERTRGTSPTSLSPSNLHSGKAPLSPRGGFGKMTSSSLL